MKIYVMYPYFDYECDRMTPFHCYIKIEDDYDIEVLSKIVGEGDFLRIRGSFWMIIRNVDLIEGPPKILQVEGRKHGTIEEAVTIRANIEIELEYEEIDADKIRKLEKIYRENDKFEIYKQSLSSEHIQNEGFRILQQYIDRKPYKVVYGNEAVSSMEEELAQVVFVSWKFIKVQEERMFHILTQDSHKYKKTNIVVIWKGNEHYEELKNYGGIVGVLF